VPLVIAGDGPELRTLRELARGADVGFVVAPTSEQLRELYRSARALVVPGVEDFGMTMVEAQACGTPVLALGVGGAREAVVDGETGWLLAEERAEAFAAAMLRCEPDELDPTAIRTHASRFDVPTFHERIRAIAARALAGAEVAVPA
jgi:glycosyltransferase involved in cell wall biosynthesis